MTSHRYRCARCGRTCSPEEANRVSFICHGAPMQRVTHTTDGVRPSASPYAAQALGDSTLGRLGEDRALTISQPDGWVVRRILPPPRNEVDAEAVEQLLGSLHGASGSLSLEIAGSARQRQLLVRGAPQIVNTVVHQLQGAYGQVSWQDPGDDDPALCFSSSDPEKGVSVAHCCLGLRRSVFFPLKTWREFEAADPLQVLLGAFRGLQNREQLLSQLVLLEPAPDDWADAYQGSLQTIDYRTQATTLAGQARAALFALAILLAAVGVVALFLCAGTLLRPGVEVPDVLKAFVGAAALGVLNLALAKLGWRWWRQLRTRLNANPEVVQRKARLPAFRCALRLWAVAGSPDRAEELMQRLTSAYRLYNLAEGNALIVEKPREKRSLDSLYHRLRTQQEGVSSTWAFPWLRQALSALRRALAGETGMILNLAELAGLWHMPVGDAPELVRREEHDRFVPLPEDVEDPEGVHIGCSIKDDQTTVRVSLSWDALRRNSLLMGKTQMGKSNLMEILARRAMRDQDGALVVLDPQGDMARALRGMVPPDRIGEAYYIDFADRERVVSLNLLDMTLGAEVDKVVSDLIGLGEAIWSRFWGPRMEATWRYAAKTLALINQDLVAEGFADEQYTLLDIPALLLAPEKRRRHFVSRNLSWESPAGRDAHWWWNTYYEELRSSLQQDVISPVLTKVFRVAGNNVSRMAFGQPRSTLDVRRVLSDGGILLVHTAHGELGEEIGGFIGAVFLNMLNVVIRERSQAKRAGRRPCMVIIDEFQSIPSVDYAALLSELQKFEVSFVLGTQSLARLRSIGPELPGVSFAGVTTVLSFQTNFEDAEYLSGELDGVEPSNLVDLEPFEAYVKTTGKDGERLPVYSVRTRKAAAPDPGVAARVVDRVSGFTLPAVDAEKRPGKLAAELGGGDSSERVEQLEANLHRAGGESLFSKELLTKLARMTATKSAQAFQGAAGNVGRGLPTMAEKPASAPSGQTPGFRALDAERER